MLHICKFNLPKFWRFFLVGTLWRHIISAKAPCVAIRRQPPQTLIKALMHAHTRAHTHTHTRTYTHTCVHARAYTQAHAHAGALKYERAHVCVSLRAHTIAPWCTQHTCPCLHAPVRPCALQVQPPSSALCALRMKGLQRISRAGTVPVV